jgi:hypothetical protein
MIMPDRIMPFRIIRQGVGGLEAGHRRLLDEPELAT